MRDVGSSATSPLAIQAGLFALASAAVFLAVAALYRAGVTHDLDHALALRLREVHSGWLDGLSAVDDVLFRATPTIAVAAVLTVVLWRFGGRWAWCAPPAILIALLAEAIVKNGWSQVLHIRALIDGLQALFGGHYHAPASFPSGHVMRAMFLGVIGLAFLPRWISIPFALFALTTPLARMYTEQHRLSDVLGGAALGVCVAYAAVWGARVLAATKDRPTGRSAAGPQFPPKGA
jgi:membrane-associated phospholipid phosphatase